MTRQILIFIVAFSVTYTASAESPEKSDHPLSVMDFFVGSCWDGVFSDGKSTDVHCLRPVYGGLYVRDNHRVEGARGPIGGETIFHWNAEARRILYTYWDTRGGVSQGELIPTENGLRSPEEVYEMPDGREMRIASSWVITGDDTWEQRAEDVTGDVRKTLWTIRYQRTPLGTGPAPDAEGCKE